jgi:hypothetical protein
MHCRNTPSKAVVVHAHLPPHNSRVLRNINIKGPCKARRWCDLLLHDVRTKFRKNWSNALGSHSEKMILSQRFLNKIGRDDVRCISVGCDRYMWWAFVNTVMNIRVLQNVRNFLST